MLGVTLPLRRSARALRQVAGARTEQVPESEGRRGIPEATISRLPLYHRTLVGLCDRGICTVSSDELAKAAGVTSAKLRKDLSHLGSYGVRGVGYDVDALLAEIARALGLSQEWPVVICGLGHLGQALARYSGFADRGVRVVGLLDSDPEKVGSLIDVHVADGSGSELPIRPLADLEDLISEVGAAIAVITTPAGAAQGVCDRLVAAGIRSILNFAPTVLEVPEGVSIRKVDLFSELQILAFHEQRRQAVTA